MKKKVRKALESLKKTLSEDEDPNYLWLEVNKDAAKTLVKWAEKQATRVDPSIPLKVGDRVKSKIDYPALPFVVKGAKGVIDFVDESDELYPYAVLLDDDKRGDMPRRIGFKHVELKKVG